MRILALIVLVLGFLLVWGGFSVGDPTPLDDHCPQAQNVEYGVTYDPQWWPPGTIECEASSIEGDPLGSMTFVPWEDYAVVVLFALAVAVFRLRPARALASFGLVIAGLAVFFL